MSALDLIVDGLRLQFERYSVASSGLNLAGWRYLARTFVSLDAAVTDEALTRHFASAAGVDAASAEEIKRA